MGLCCGLHSQSVASSYTVSTSKDFLNQKDIFGTRVFAENHGQFSKQLGEEVSYVIDNGLEKIYFTKTGLIYELTEVFKLPEWKLEALEKGTLKPEDTYKKYFVKMAWDNCNPHVTIEAAEKQSHYISYGEKELNSCTYKKITYKSVYPGIDIEYVIADEKNNGVKYSVIASPGSDLSKFQIKYTGDVSKIKMNSDGEIVIKTPSYDIVEHAPFSFDENGKTLPSTFIIDKNVISFSVQGVQSNSKVTIDPWVSLTTTLTSNSYAYDVDYDFLGNTFVYGGYNPYKVAMYSPTGVLQWCFAGVVGSVSWNSAPIVSQASNFGVNRFTSKTFIGQGYVGSGNRLIRLDASGNYDNFVNVTNSNFQEVWDMGFHCLTADVFVLGGGTSSNISAVTINTLTSSLNLTTFQPTNPNIAQDVASHAIDDAANIFVLYAGITSVNNKITLVNSAFNGNTWTQPSTFSTFNEQGNKNQYQGAGTLSSNGFNALAVNANYLYYYDGSNLAAYLKTTGVLVASAVVPVNTVKRQGGIAVDDCDNLYLGGNGIIHVYNFNGTAFSTLTPIPLSVTTTNQYVFDLKLDKQTKKLYVAGSGFAGVYSPVNTLACPTASSMCLFSQGGINVVTTSVSCASLGTGTCNSVGGTGPFTYTWMPSGQTGSTAINLQPGNHVIVVTDIGANLTYTTTAYLPPLVPLTGSVTNPIYVNCFGDANATASITNLAGGSGNQSYLWTNGITSQTTPVITGLGPGVYTVTVIDALTSCSISPTFSVLQPPALTLTIAATGSSACVNTGITMTPFMGGGTPAYTFSWSSGATTGINVVSESTAGVQVYSLTLFDSKNCSLTKTVSVNFIGGPLLTMSSTSVCPGQTGTVTAAGAQSYTWSNSTNGASYSFNPPTTTVYTVSATGSLCISTGTAQIFVKSVPSPTFSTNAPVCAGQALIVSVSGGTSYIWSGPQNFISSLQQATITNPSVANNGIYNYTVTGANSCTASGSGSVQIYAQPPVSATGGSICITQTLNLNCITNANTIQFLWLGPNFFSSTIQNPIVSSSLLSNGAYTVIVTDINSCTNSAVANISITAMPQPSISSNSPICSGKPLLLGSNGTTGGINYQWNGPNNYFSAASNPTIASTTLLSAGIYSLTAFAGPCQSSITKTVTVNSLPPVSTSGSVNVCEGRGFTITAISPAALSYTWLSPGGIAGTNSVLIRSTAFLSNAQNYTLVVRDANQCENSVTVQADVRKNPVLAIANPTTCLMSAASIVANGAANYVWNCPVFYQANGAQMTVPSVQQNNITFSVLGTAANGCTATTSGTIFAWPLPVATLSLSPADRVCFNEDITFFAGGGTSYQWTGPSAQNFKGQTIKVPMVNKGFEGLYTLKVTDKNGCTAITTTVATILPVPFANVNISSPQACVPFCSTFSVDLNSSTSLTPAWLNSGVWLNTSSYKDCYTEPGVFTYTMMLTDNLTNCKNTMNFVVNAFEKPQAKFYWIPEQPIELMDEVVFVNTSTGQDIQSIVWTIKTSTENKTITGPNAEITFPDAGNYPTALVVKNKWNCADTLIKTINVMHDFLIYVPNVFTPNHDHLNDVFLPVTRGIKTYHLQIFDRWGALLFESSDPQIGWNGQFKEILCMADVYVWKIKATGLNGQMKEMSGHVTLTP